MVKEAEAVEMTEDAWLNEEFNKTNAIWDMGLMGKNYKEKKKKELQEIFDRESPMAGCKSCHGLLEKHVMSEGV